MAELKDDRLTGWKSIGTFVGRDARTARRWEAERGLPVHRVPGGGSATVWSTEAELRAWMAGGAADDSEQPGTSAASRRKVFAIGVTALIAAVGAGALALGVASPSQPRSAPYGADQAATKAFDAASYAMQRRSVAGLLEAERGFSDLARSHPGNAAAFVGLAQTNLLLREFNSLPDEVAYRRAEMAAQRALALDPGSVGALRSLAFIRYWSDGRAKDAFALFERALNGDPGDPQTLHWYGTALLGEGRFADALGALNRAKQQDPGSSAIAADTAYVRFMAGERSQAVADLVTITQVDPEFSGAHSYLARLYLVEGKDADFLREAVISARLKRDTDEAALIGDAAQAFRTGGRGAMLGTLIADAARRFAQDGQTALDLARFEAAAGNRAGVLEWLGRAESIRQPELRSLIAYPDFVPFRNDPAFARFFPAR